MNFIDTRMAVPNSLDGLLEKAVDLAYRAVLSISQSDHASARNHVDQLRFVKASADTKKPHQAHEAETVPTTHTTLERIRCAMEALAISDGVIQDWIQHRVRAVALGEVSDPMEVWQCLIDQALPASWNFDVDLFVVFGGPDLQLHAALERRGQRRVLFVLEGDDSESTERNQGALFAASDAQILSVVGELHRPYPDRVAQLNLREEGDADPRLFEQMAAIQKALLGLWVNFNTREHFGKTWLEQGVGNIPLLAKHRNLSELDGIFKGQPAILMAPGPSLEKNIDQIRALKGKALLLAPLQSLRRLYVAGIQPDFVVVLDPADQTVEPLNFFQDVPGEFLPPLIAAANSHPHVLERFNSVYVYSSGGPLDHWVHAAMGEPLLPLIAPSVALIGVLLARHWQCSPIILTGQDLALQDGKQYAAGSNLKSGSKRRLYSLPGFYGGTVQSPSDYYMFHHQFELLAKDMATNQPHIELYNCTEGGAFIEGFEHRSLQQVVASHLDHQGEGEVCARMQLIGQNGKGYQLRLSMVKRHLENSLATIDASIKQAAHCRRLTMGGATGGQFFKRLDAEERKLRGLIKRIAGFSVLYQGDVDRALKASAQAASLRENLDASRALYAVVSEGCAILRPLVVQALGQCSSRHLDASLNRALPCVSA